MLQKINVGEADDALLEQEVVSEALMLYWELLLKKQTTLENAPEISGTGSGLVTGQRRKPESSTLEEKQKAMPDEPKVKMQVSRVRWCRDFVVSRFRFRLFIWFSRVRGFARL